MPRWDVNRRNKSCFTGFSAEDAAALGVTRQAEQAEVEQKIRCTAELPDYNFRGCGAPLNSSNARKVRNKKRLPICGPCRRELCRKSHSRRYELNQLINMIKPPHQKPLGSGRRKKREEQKIDL